MQKNQLNQRLSHTIVIALAIHLMVIFTVGFSWAKAHNNTTSIEVTLATQQAKEKIDEADFFAQIDQQGSGEALEKKHLSHKTLSEYSQHNTLPQQKIAEASQLSNDPKATQGPETTEVITDFDVIVALQSDLTHLEKQLSKPNNEQNTLLKTANISEQIATLRSEINLRQEQMARAPKKRTISTISTKSHQDAEYLENWRRKIISVGNSHYPKAANEQKIYGRVRLLIAMQAEGHIKSIEILESSGKKILDHSAVKIIKLAAPFQPFSPQMRKNTDILEIIRTVEFEKSTLIY